MEHVISGGMFTVLEYIAQLYELSFTFCALTTSLCRDAKVCEDVSNGSCKGLPGTSPQSSTCYLGVLF